VRGSHRFTDIPKRSVCVYCDCLSPLSTSHSPPAHTHTHSLSLSPLRSAFRVFSLLYLFHRSDRMARDGETHPPTDTAWGYASDDGHQRYSLWFFVFSAGSAPSRPWSVMCVCAPDVPIPEPTQPLRLSRNRTPTESSRARDGWKED
jgi:hypothetical protein